MNSTYSYIQSALQSKGQKAHNNEQNIAAIKELNELPEESSAYIAKRNEIVSHNLAFVFSIARNYAKSDYTKVEDFFNEGVLGLIKAIESFNVEENKFFTPYAKSCICGSILTTIKEGGLVKSNRYAIAISKYRESYFAKFGNYPTEGEMEEFMATKGIKGHWSFYVTTITTSIDAPTNEEGETFSETNATFMERTSCEQNEDCVDDKIARIKATFTPLEKILWGAMMESVEEKGKVSPKFVHEQCKDHFKSYEMCRIAITSLIKKVQK